MDFDHFKNYIEELMELRGWDGSSTGGLIMAGVGDNQITVLELSEFIIAAIPELASKLILANGLTSAGETLFHAPK